MFDFSRLLAPVAAVTLAGALLMPITPLDARQNSRPEAQGVTASKSWQLAAGMRDLWIGHIFWVRNVAIATLEKNPAAAEVAEQQAIANARGIAAAIEPFYGAEAKNRFFTLLSGHYGAIKDYLIATVKDDASAEAKATDALASNADAIARFLSSANPNLAKDAVAGLLLVHGSHHIQQIQELKVRQYSAEAKTWEEMKNHMYVIADAVTDALAKQFAAKR